MTLTLQTAEQNYQFGYSEIKSDLEQESFPGELALLRQQSNQLNQTIDKMPTGFVMLDGNGIVTKVNKVASELLDEPVLGQPWYNVIRRSFKPRADDWHEVSLKDGRRVKLEISPLGNQPGQLIMITDLTETRLLQGKIGQMQRLSSLGKMVSSLAHQIRTPLSAAMLYGANLATPNLSVEAKRGFQGKLMSRLQDLESQVNDMLLFAKSGKEQVVEKMSINNLLSEVQQGIESLVKREGGTLMVEQCDDDCLLLCNKTALAGALQNLVQNSLQAIGQGAEISINIQCLESNVEISVKDNGPGIDCEQAEKIFEPFFTSRVNGTGLGLAVVKSVATAHHGQVAYLDDHQGAHFKLTLPLINQ